MRTYDEIKTEIKRLYNEEYECRQAIGMDTTTAAPRRHTLEFLIGDQLELVMPKYAEIGYHPDDVAETIQFTEEEINQMLHKLMKRRIKNKAQREACKALGWVLGIL